MLAMVVWKGGLAFTGRAERGHQVDMAASTSNDGGASPMEVVMMALTGCTAIDVLSTLQNKRQQVKEFAVLVQAENAMISHASSSEQALSTSLPGMECGWLSWRMRWSYPEPNTAQCMRC